MKKKDHALVVHLSHLAAIQHACLCFWCDRQVTFARPVVATSVLVYVANDGVSHYDLEPKTMILTLVGINGTEYKMDKLNTTLVCQQDPLKIDIVHNLSEPFFHTQGMY